MQLGGLSAAVCAAASGDVAAVSSQLVVQAIAGVNTAACRGAG